VKKRPVGVVIVGIVLMVLGVLGIVGVPFVWLFAGESQPRHWVLGATGSILLSLISGIGILMLKNWARLLLLFWTGASLAMSAVQLVIGGPQFLHPAVTLVWYGFMLWYFWYFLRPSVKAQFQRR
jgi:hypothetical protein